MWTKTLKQSKFNNRTRETSVIRQNPTGVEEFVIPITGDNSMGWSKGSKEPSNSTWPPGGALLHGGGAHSARTLEFWPECLNQLFKTLYSSRQAFLTIQNKNWPNYLKIGRVIQIIVSRANFWKNWIILSNVNNLVNFHSFELWFFANILVLLVLKDCKIKIGGQVHKYFFDFFRNFFEGGKRGYPPQKIFWFLLQKPVHT